ncbi:actin [Artibeus jamaicensis]|uniref:actin n=1 Tax=Artibeus jamaicensis TaxID=9417 RepID=UPI00235AED40|nr:actin [Artibeus jamaicensis]
MNVPLICDYGSGFSKVGYSGMETPLAVFPTILGKLRHDGLLVGLEEKDWFLGSEAQSRLGELNLLRPICRASITNWDHMEKIWHHTFYRVLCTAPEQHPLLLTEPPSVAPSVKEKVSEILFETFNVPALYLANQGVLSLYASGLTWGTTIESGEGMTHFVPITEGCPLHQSTMKMDVAGQDITLYLMQLLSAQGSSLIGTALSVQLRLLDHHPSSNNDPSVCTDAQLWMTAVRVTTTVMVIMVVVVVMTVVMVTIVTVVVLKQ